MEKNKYYLVTGLVLSLIAVIGISAVTFIGQAHDRDDGLPEIDSIKDIFANDDYDAWVDMMNQKADWFDDRADQIRDNISQETFDTMVEIRRLLEAGNYQEAKELIDELDFHFGPKMFNKHKFHHR